MDLENSVFVFPKQNFSNFVMERCKITPISWAFPSLRSNSSSASVFLKLYFQKQKKKKHYTIGAIAIAWILMSFVSILQCLYSNRLKHLNNISNKNLIKSTHRTMCEETGFKAIFREQKINAVTIYRLYALSQHIVKAFITISNVLLTGSDFDSVLYATAVK